MKQFAQSVREVSALLIDVGGNPGGFTSDWHNLVKLITREPMQYDQYFAPRNGFAAMLPPEIPLDRPEQDKHNFSEEELGGALTQSARLPVETGVSYRPAAGIALYPGLCRG